MWVELLLSAPITFIIIFVILYLVYYSGRYTAFKHQHTEAELDPYACGEGPDKYPAEYIQMNVQLYRFAMYFTIFDVAAFLLAISVSSPILVLALYIAVITAALILLPKG